MENFFEGGAAMYTMAKKPKTCDTVQCVRKRVSGNGARIEGSDLFYDKSDGKYYTQMREIRYCRDCQIYPDEYQKYLHEARKDRSAHTLLLAELPDKTTYMKDPRPLQPDEGTGPRYARPLAGSHYAGILVHRGTEEMSPPPTVRLYSEAEMAHAAKLAETMTSGEKYNAFRRIEVPGTPEAPYSGKRPLIKATEYDDRDHVLARYSSAQQSKRSRTKAAFMAGRLMAVQHGHRFGASGVVSDAEKRIMQQEKSAQIRKETKSIRTVYPSITQQNVLSDFERGYDAVNQGLPARQKILAARESFASMEVSYGGSTGDMTFRRLPQLRYLHYRQYPVIQSTFFWMPGVGSMGNAEAMFRFFTAQYHRLEPGGIIRMISYSNNQKRRKEDEKKWWGAVPNQYLAAAEWVKRRLERETGYTDVRIILLKSSEGKAQPYSDRLADKGLNPSNNDSPAYRPLWTDVNKAIGGIEREESAGAEAATDNLVLQARKSRVFRP